MIKHIILFTICVLLNGCIFLHNQKEQVPDDLYINYNEDSLKSTDITYGICGEPVIKVYIDGKTEKIKFNEDWFIVNIDLLKTFNENQNYILNVLKNDNVKKKFPILK